MLSFAKKDFYKATLNENKHSYKKIFGLCNTLQGRSQELSLPTSNSNKELANDFNTFSQIKYRKSERNLTATGYSKDS